MTDTRYLEPGWFTRTVLNPSIAFATRHGLPLAGSRILAVRGRTSGAWRTTPVNPVSVGGARYLVAPRGDTQWVRNIRVAGGGELRVGRRSETVTAVELPDADKPAVIRAYLKAWAWEVGAFFPGLSKSSTDEDILAVAPGFPVFSIR